MAAALIEPIFAQTAALTNAAPEKPVSQAPAAQAKMPPLTKEQREELNQDKAAVLKADPELAAESHGLDAKRKALAEEQKEFQGKLNLAMIKIDPAAEAILPKGTAGEKK